jgi:hypothetical protein
MAQMVEGSSCPYLRCLRNLRSTILRFENRRTKARSEERVARPFSETDPTKAWPFSPVALAAAEPRCELHVNKFGFSGDRRLPEKPAVRFAQHFFSGLVVRV